MVDGITTLRHIKVVCPSSKQLTNSFRLANTFTRIVSVFRAKVTSGSQAVDEMSMKKFLKKWHPGLDFQQNFMHHDDVKYAIDVIKVYKVCITFTS